MDRKQQMRNADQTSTLTATVRMLEKTDFTTMMGSGIMVRLTPITDGRSLGEEFLLPAEDMQAVAPLFAQSIRNYLERRSHLLRAELAEIEKTISK